MSSLIEGKDETISQLSERVSILEQRVQDGELTGDERVIALEAEVRLMG